MTAARRIARAGGAPGGPTAALEDRGLFVAADGRPEGGGVPLSADRMCETFRSAFFVYLACRSEPGNALERAAADVDRLAVDEGIRRGGRASGSIAAVFAAPEGLWWISAGDCVVIAGGGGRRARAAAGPRLGASETFAVEAGFMAGRSGGAVVWAGAAAAAIEAAGSAGAARVGDDPEAAAARLLEAARAAGADDDTIVGAVGRPAGRRADRGARAAAACALAAAIALGAFGALRGRLEPEGSPDAGVRAALSGWEKAWESRETGPYMEWYARDFGGGAAGRDAWRRKKERINAGKAWIRVTISDVGIEPVGGGRVRTTFVQEYESPGHRETGRKEMVWTLEDGGWRILSERME